MKYFTMSRESRNRIHELNEEIKREYGYLPDKLRNTAIVSLSEVPEKDWESLIDKIYNVLSIKTIMALDEFPKYRLVTILIEDRFKGLFETYEFYYTNLLNGNDYTTHDYCRKVRMSSDDRAPILKALNDVPQDRVKVLVEVISKLNTIYIKAAGRIEIIQALKELSTNYMRKLFCFVQEALKIPTVQVHAPLSQKLRNPREVYFNDFREPNHKEKPEVIKQLTSMTEDSFESFVNVTKALLPSGKTLGIKKIRDIIKIVKDVPIIRVTGVIDIAGELFNQFMGIDHKLKIIEILSKAETEEINSIVKNALAEFKKMKQEGKNPGGEDMLKILQNLMKPKDLSESWAWVIQPHSSK